MTVTNQQLKTTTNSVNTSNSIDGNSPFSFKEWQKAYNAVIDGQEYDKYNQYLTGWYTIKRDKNIEFNTQLRLDYLNLLRQLQLFLTTEEKQNWYNNIDLNSEKEVLLSIPFFARKLKEIAVYYLKIREEIKKTKIKYNLVGTNTGIIQQLQEQLLNSFTKKPNSYTTIPATIWSGIPTLSSVKDNLTIEIEELYDDHSYFDQSPNLPLSTYFNLTSTDTKTFLTQKGFDLSAVDWAYKAGQFYTQIEPLLQQLSAVEVEGLGRAIEYADKVLTKYLGTEKYYSLFAGLSSRLDIYAVSLSSGNNFFYWPYGPFRQNIDTIIRYKGLPLSAAGLELLGTPGETIENADTIFVKTAKGMEGAWLKFNPYYQTVQDIVTYIDGDSKTIFKYPFPGFGLSGENTDWIGPQITYTPEFVYLDPDIKTNIEKLYWDYPPTLSAITPVSINNTTLIDAGAYANTQYELADKVRQWKVAPDSKSTAYNGDTIESWLYKMLKTDLPIGVSPTQATDNIILWPYTRLDPGVEFPTYIPADIYTACQPTLLQNINLQYATASDTLSSELGDVIYKIPSYRSTEDEAYEAAWLYGPRMRYDYDPSTGTYYEKIQQDSLSHIFLPNGYTQFVWDGPDNTDIEEVFKSYPHQPTCPYHKNPAATPEDHPLCDCAQVLFSPFGHPGERFIDFNQYTDFIAEDTQYPFVFDITTWNDPEGNFFDTSNVFAWYQTTNNKLGWGYGNWKTGMGLTTNKFYLRAGKRYVYYRSNTRVKDPQLEAFPALVVRYPYNNKKTTWLKAVRDENGNWIQTDIPSDMEIYAGDLLLYKKAPGVYQDYHTTTQIPLATAVNTGSIWANYDYVSLYPNDGGDIPTISYRYPSQLTTPVPKNLNTNQTTTTPNSQSTQYYNVLQTRRTKLSFYKRWQNTLVKRRTALSSRAQKQIAETPITVYTSLLGISAWVLTTPPSAADGTGRQTTYINNALNFTFTPYSSGVYTVRAIAITSENIGQVNTSTQQAAKLFQSLNTNTPLVTGLYYINNITSLTAGYLTTTLSTISTLYVPTPGYVINAPLYGWNYNFHTISPSTLGARPFWAIGFSNKNDATQFKGINSWGTPYRIVDGHNVITQPLFSDSFIEAGDYFEYERKYPTAFIWSQPTSFLVTINEVVWNTIVFETTGSSNLSPILNNLTYQLVTSATDIPSNIVLNNVVDNDLVEVYYNAASPLTWNVSAEPEITETVINSLTSSPLITPTNAWNSIPNRNFPTIATLPTLENLYSSINSGGYFVPQNLGTSLYLNKTFTTSLNLTSSALSSIFNDGTDFPTGRGLSKQDQPTPYTEILDNNAWLKEPIISGSLAGTIKKSIARTHQKFIPYQSERETNRNQQTGLILPTSRQSPWGGDKDAVWTDTQNNPTSFTGVPNISAWASTQLLKQTGKQLDCWVTDIYGNQYGLYKNMRDVDPYNRRFIGGELWTRKNSQFVSPALKSLSSVFDTYTNTYLLQEFYNSGIQKIDIFFDTLYVETSGTVIFEKVLYNYGEDKIYSITDDARFLSLALPVTLSLNREIANSVSNSVFAKAGDTWFEPQEKNVFISVCGLSGTKLLPELYKLDLYKRDFFRVFPNTNDITTLNELTALNLQHIDPPVLTYNAANKEFIYTILGNNNNDKNIIIELYIKNLPITNLTNVYVYEPKETLYASLPPVIVSNLHINIPANITTTYQILADNNPTPSYLQTSTFNWVTLNRLGLFTITPPTTGVYYIPFNVSNEVGPTYNTLTINVTS